MFILFDFVERIYQLIDGVTFAIVMWKLEQVLVGIHAYISFVFDHCNFRHQQRDIQLADRRAFDSSATL